MTTFATRLENGTDTAARMRMADALSLSPAAPGIPGARSGVRNDAGAAVSVNTGTMNVTVSPFSGYLDGGASNAQGGYVVVNDATAVLAINPGHATLARVDVIAVVINDTAYDGSGLTDCTLRVVEGTPGGGSPALPVTCLPLRNINVPAGLSAGTGGLSSGNLSTDRRTYIPQGILRVGSEAERNAASVGARGTCVYRVDTDVLEVWNGSNWRVYKPAPAVTPWTNIPLRSGFSATSGETPQYIKEGNTVTLRGRIEGSFTTGGNPVGDLPAGFRPTIANEIWATSFGINALPGRFFIGSGGAITVDPEANTNGAVPISVTFRVD